MRVNLTGTFNVTQKAAAILRNGGRIVNMSSVSGQMGLFGQANYSSSKAAIIALTKVSAREFARQNITVNAIAPGFIDVGMSKGMPDEVDREFQKTNSARPPWRRERDRQCRAYFSPRRWRATSPVTC